MALFTGPPGRIIRDWLKNPKWETSGKKLNDMPVTFGDQEILAEDLFHLVRYFTTALDVICRQLYQ